MMDEDLRLPLPRDKYDTRSAAELVTLGWNKVERAIPEILEWLRDINWPVATIFVPFFVDAGVRLAPFIRPIFAADDAIWTFNILHEVVSQSPALASELSGELERLAYSPTVAERLEGVSHLARQILRTASVTRSEP
jgi:hypothetical protein